ncbi:MAG: divalent metal cation transporter [Candidatus Omnitrophica bacterium]|nr:divalent metal cation transporter [Candidatus Omnitrophota bacterium]MCB9782079.1 divalent metal cation transporter [Candidatus Omnitrophota bacterium]
MNDTTQTKGGFFGAIAGLIGPAAVMTAGIMGAGSTVSLVTAGCYFEYSLLWVVFLSLPVIVICQDTASRIGLISGEKGMMQIIAEQTHPAIMWFMVVPLLFTCITANIGQLGAMTAGVSGLVNQITGEETIPSTLTVAGRFWFFTSLAILCILINATGGYKRTEKILSYLLFVVLISFAIVAFKAFLNFEEVKKMFQGLIPAIPADVEAESGAVRKGFVSFAGIFGGGVAATAILSFPYFTTEGGYTKEQVRGQFVKHLILLGGVFGFYSCILLIAGGYALHPLEGSAGFEGAGEMGQALGVLGPFGPPLFSFGLMICAYTTLIVVAQLAAYFVLDCLGMNWRFEKGNKAFLFVFALFIFLPAVMGPVWEYPELLKVVISMVVNTLVAPLAIVMIVWLINKKAFAGDLKASPLRNLFLAYSVGVACFTCIRSAIGFFNSIGGLLEG